MELIRYLEAHFYTEAQLLEAAAIGNEELARLQARGLMPQPSYVLRLRAECNSFFGEHSEQMRERYYAKGYAAWIAAVRGMADEDEGYRLFSARYLAKLAALDSAWRPDMHAEWRAFLNGTYGLCTRSGLPEDIAQKEMATAALRALPAPLPKPMPHAERLRTLALIDLLDQACALFAPHERMRSSRHSLVDTLRAQLASTVS